MRRLDRRVAVCSSSVLVAAVKKAAAMPTFRISLGQTPASPGRARARLRSFIEENDLSDEPEVALLILSELVTNAVMHGATPIQVVVSGEPGKLRIDVTDGGTHAPGPEPYFADADQTGGRGLHIVNALSHQWGTTIHEHGKSVWAEVTENGRHTRT
jgi:anti-sigma regulatory factor (Ser/Thr protein kinase)